MKVHPKGRGGLVAYLSTESGELLLSFTVEVGSRGGSQSLAEELVGLHSVEGLGLHWFVVALNSWKR